MPRWIRFLDGERERFGLLQGEQVLPHAGDMFDAPAPEGGPLALADVTLLAPCSPRSFVGLWNNFRELAQKTGQPEPQEPLFFLKPQSSILPPGGAIRAPATFEGRILFEGELGIVVGKRCERIAEADADAAIFGYTCVNDVTALDWLKTPEAFPQWTRAKGCDTFGPFGPAIATGLDWSTLVIRTAVNGRPRQNYRADDMILPPQRIVSLLSREMTLQPGDVIACGTSVGSAPLRAGDEVVIEIDGIGRLANRFERAEAR